MELILAILIYLGVISGSGTYTDVQIKDLAKENKELIKEYNKNNNAPSASASIQKTVWDHEQL